MPAVIPPYFQRDMPAVSHSHQAPTATTTAPLPIRRHPFATPKLRLQLEDLAHEGSVRSCSLAVMVLDGHLCENVVDSVMLTPIVFLPRSQYSYPTSKAMRTSKPKSRMYSTSSTPRIARGKHLIKDPRSDQQKGFPDLSHVLTDPARAA